METAEGRTFPRLHWGAIIAGVLLALAAHVVLGLVGAALGFAAEPADSEALGVGAAMWALVTPFVATLLGAWLACRLAAAHEDRSANLHGVLVWCVGLIAGALFLTGTMATGAMTAGTAASGNLGFARRMARGGDARPDTVVAEQRADDAGRAAAAAAGGAALASLAGLLGAIVGAAIASRRSTGRGLGWRIAIQRQDERRGGLGSTERLHDRPYAPGAHSTATAEPRRPGASPEAGPPTDPYHH
jgi:MFS family permease